jgi:hypothetical protein
MASTQSLKKYTYSEAGLTKEDVLTLILSAILENPDGVTTKQVYEIINTELAKSSSVLSFQGEATLRNLLSSSAPPKGNYIYKNEFEKWVLTVQGKEKIEEMGNRVEEVIDETTGETKTIQPSLSNTVKGGLLEEYVLGLLKIIYPHYTWYHQGKNKNNERGLDLIANKLGDALIAHENIGVQIKNHLETNAPNDNEWQKFLAGCFLRHVDNAMFITTGKLTSNQWREAGEAKIIVIAGKDELNRIAKFNQYQTYDEFLKKTDDEDQGQGETNG